MLAAAKRMKLREHLGLKATNMFDNQITDGKVLPQHPLFHFIKPSIPIRPMRMALSQSVPGLD